MNRIRALLLLCGCVLLLGCNTVSGVGKDVGEAGEAIEKSAEQ